MRQAGRSSQGVRRGFCTQSLGSDMWTSGVVVEWLPPSALAGLVPGVFPPLKRNRWSSGK